MPIWKKDPDDSLESLGGWSSKKLSSKIVVVEYPEVGVRIYYEEGKHPKVASVLSGLGRAK